MKVKRRIKRTRLLDAGDEQGIRLVDLAQAVEHLGQLGRVDWLHCNLHRCQRVKLYNHMI